MKELFKIEYEVKINGNYKKVITTATEIIVQRKILLYMQYNTGETIQHNIENIKNLIIKEL